ncbi:HisA/HisF family protein [Methanobrevibacter boviskoreani]|uniref:HisA/HisF family protein n=1 Tax=Methanobrevibacter boviskoreani TaxID=1348249 RepID=UPI0023A79F23|nr:HisA/HisF family protein [Methanobrevibacter boviskoreani]MCI6774963.1 HisA/HisF family protein [Methanobrevibacter boviskoreani]MDY5614180.1 HisA/HisF family protein [Methanobrevibacter boviskoreani]
MIEIVPVLDLIGNQAVSGKSGNRSTYTPLNTIYAPNSDPLNIANGLELNGAKEIYIADLDLIEKQGNNLYKIKDVNTVLPVMLDCGIRDFESFKFYLDFAYKLIVATETIESIDEMRKIFNTFPRERIVVSVDIKDGQLYSNNLDMNLEEFRDVLRELDPNEIILLNLSDVGTGNGYDIRFLDDFKEFKDKIIIGGGINQEDLELLERYGVKKALIGTALHNGSISIL